MTNKTPLLLISALTAAIFSCKQGPDYKAVRDEVVRIHDSVMLNTEKAYLNKRRLDTLVTNLDSLKKVQSAIDTSAEKQKMNKLRARLEDADNQMSDWMHQFNADASEKSSDEAISYFSKEKEKIKSIDSIYINLLKESSLYLSRFSNK